MLPSARAVKTTAKAQLKNQWPNCICVGLIPVAAFLFLILFGILISIMVPKNVLAIPFIFILVVLTVFLSIPLIQGCIRWFWFFSIEKPLGISHVFYYYSEWNLVYKTIVLYTLTIWNLMLKALLCYIPLIISYLLTNQNFYELIGISAPLIIPVLWPIYYLLFAVCSVLFIFVAQNNLFALIVMVIDEDLDCIEIIILAKKLLKGKNGSAFLLFFSFFGWMLINFLGIPLVFTIPYMLMAYAVFAKFLVFNHRYEQGIIGEKPLI